MNSQSPAGRRYTRRFIPLMALYLGAIFLTVWVSENQSPEGALRYALAVLPALPIIGVIWVVGLYLHEEEDEYIRMRLATVSLYATGVTLALATVWGFLEAFGGVPHLPLYWAFIVFWAAFGVVQLLMKAAGR